MCIVENTGKIITVKLHFYFLSILIKVYDSLKKSTQVVIVKPTSNFINRFV